MTVPTPPADEVLILAISGRALAQSAAKMGCRVRVFDAFADRDTQAVAQTVCVAADAAIALSGEKLLAALADLDGALERRAIIVGSGFERSPQWLERLDAYGTPYANDSEIVAAAKDPELSAELLRALGWQVPDTRRDPPADLRGWLQKDIGGAGGVHVRRAEQAVAHARAYYQRQLPGRPVSVTFLADAEQAWVLGYNAQSVRAVGAAPFCYAGAATCTLEPALARAIQVRLDRMVRVTGLRGLNGLDFLLADGDVAALELNPRPTATFELYEPDFPEGLVAWHLRSFAQRVPEFGARLARPASLTRAYAVIYAEDAVHIPEQAQFPSWCRDLPAGGSMIRAGAPVLCVFAQAENEALARRCVEQRRGEVRRLLARWKAAAGCAV